MRSVFFRKRIAGIEILAAAALAALWAFSAAPASGQSPVRITEGAANNPAQYMGKQAANYPMLQVALQNLGAAAVELCAVRIQAEGSLDELTAIAPDGVRLVHDANGDGEAGADPAVERVLGTGQFSEDNGTILFDFTGAPLALAGQASTNLVVTWSLAGVAETGQTARVFLAEEASVVMVTPSTGLPVQFQEGAFPVNGIQKEIGQGVFTVRALPDSVNASIPPYFIAGLPRSEGVRLQLENSLDERLALRRLVIGCSGTADESLITLENGIEYVPLAASNTTLTPAAPALAAGTIARDNGSVEFVFDPPLTFARGQTRYAAVAVSCAAVREQYFRDMRFFLDPNSAEVEGLESLEPQIAVLGEGLAGPLRLYHGHLNTLTVKNDPTNPTAYPGATNVAALPFELRNDKFEDITLRRITFSVSGTLNDAAEIERVTLWRDNNTDGEITPPGGTGTTDDEIATSASFTLDNGTVTFTLDPPIDVQKDKYIRLVAAVDVSASATVGATFRFAIARVDSVEGAGKVSGAPVVSSPAPLQARARTIVAPPPPLPPRYTLSEMISSRDAKERRFLPRTGRNLVLWNFAATMDDASDAYFDHLRIQVTGTIQDIHYIESIALYYDKDNDGTYLKSKPAADVKLAEITELPGEDPLLEFLPLPAVATYKFAKNRTHGFYLLATLVADAPTTVSHYGKTIRFTIPDAGAFSLRGTTNRLQGIPSPVPFASDSKEIIRPRLTLVHGPAITGGEVFTCINNGAAEVIQFRLENGPSETLLWQTVRVEGSSFDGGGGLREYTSDVDVFADTNSNGEVDSKDLFMTFSPAPFSGTTSVLDVGADMAVLGPSFEQKDLDKIQLPFGATGTFLVTYNLGSDSPVPTDGTIYFSGRIPEGGLRFVGEDSGDSVVILNDMPLQGRKLTMSLGNAELSNISSTIKDYALEVTPGAKTVEAIAFQVKTSRIEPVEVEKLVLEITQSNNDTPLETILDPDAASFYLRLNSQPAMLWGKGTINFSERTITFRRADLDPNSLYTYWTSPTWDRFEITLDIKQTAPEGEWIQLRLASVADVAFNGLCSLVASPAFPTTLASQAPYLGRPLVFGKSHLTLSLTEADEDFPDVAFPGNSTDYSVVRMSFENNKKLEPVRVRAITFETTGTAHDTDALTSPGVQLVINRVVVARGSFSADNGRITFGGLDWLIDQKRSMEVRFNPGALTRSGANIGQTFQLSIPPDGIEAYGVTSGLRVGWFYVKDQMDQTIQRTGLPFRPPTIRIGAGRVFVNIDQADKFPLFHVRSTPDVVSMGFHLTPDRAENQKIEEVRVRAGGTMNDLMGLAGASIRLYVNKSPYDKLGAEDTRIGTGVFDADDGLARIRMTPPYALRSGSKTQFLLAVDITGLPADFETFRHVLRDPPGVQARGDLSFDIATPWYGSSATNKPNYGALWGPVHTIGKGTLDFALNGKVPPADPLNAAQISYVLPGATNFPMLAFDFTVNPVEDVRLTSFTLHTSGTANDATSVRRARLYRDLNRNGFPDATDVLLGEGAPVADNADFTLFFREPVNLSMNSAQSWLVTYDFAGSVTLNLGMQASLPLPSETTRPVEGILGGFGLFSTESVGVTRTQKSADAFVGRHAVFSSGIIEVRRGAKSPAGRTFERRQPEAPLLQLQLEERLSLEASKINLLKIAPSSSNQMDFAVAYATAVFRLYREAAGKENGLKDPEDQLLATGAYNPVTRRIEFDLSGGNLIVTKATKIQLLLTGEFDLPASQEGKIAGFAALNEDLFAGTGQTSGLNTRFSLPAGAVYSSAFTFAASATKVTRDTATPDATRFFAPDAKNITLLAVRVRPTDATDVWLRRFTVEATGSVEEAAAFIPGGVRLVYDLGATAGALDAGDVILGSGSFLSDNGRIVFTDFATSTTFPAAVTRNLIVVASLSGAAQDGQTVALRIPNEPDALDFRSKASGVRSPLTADSPLPIAGGPSPVVSRKLTLDSAPPALGPLEVLPGAANVLFQRVGMSVSAAESLRVTTVTLTLLGGADPSLSFAGGELRLMYDKNNDGALDANDSLIQSRALDPLTGVAVYSISNLGLPANNRRMMFVVGDLTPQAPPGAGFQTRLDYVSAAGSTSGVWAQVEGLPQVGRAVTVGEPRATYLRAGADSIGSNAVHNARGQVLQALLIQTGQADDLRFQGLTFEWVAEPLDPYIPMAAADIVVSGSLRLAVDSNRDGLFTAGVDALLGSGGAWVDGRVHFGPSPILFPRDREYYLMLVGDLNGSASNALIATRALAEGAAFYSVAQDREIAAGGLPLTSAPRRLVAAGQRLALPLREDFEGDLSAFAPQLAWERVLNPERARSGYGYMTATTRAAIPLNSEYGLITHPPVDMNTAPRTKVLTFWLRTRSVSDEQKLGLGISANNGANWANVYYGTSSKWQFIRKELTSAQSSAADFLTRFFVRATAVAAPGTMYEIDRALLQSRECEIETLNFNPGAGEGYSVLPGRRAYPVRFQLRNLTSRAVRIDAVGFRAQSASGLNRTSLIAWAKTSGDSSLPGSSTRDYVYALDFSESLNETLDLDLFVDFTDTATNSTYTLDSAARSSPFLITVGTPSATDILQRILGRTQGPVPAAGFDRNGDGVIDVADLLTEPAP